MDERMNTGKAGVTVHYPDGTTLVRESLVLKEHELTVIVNEQPVLKLICTRDRLRELVAGRLYTEGIIEKIEDISKIYFCRYENEASVFLNRDIEFEDTLQKDKSCCTGNRIFKSVRDRASLKKLPGAFYEPEWIFTLAGSFAEDSILHDLTQGTHSCILAERNEIIFSCEDIGRHNAVDKAAGYALINQIPPEDCILFTSGRVPLDMAEKVIAAGIPVLVSKSVATRDSIALAKEYGLTLICRAHKDSYEVVNGD